MKYGKIFIAIALALLAGCAKSNLDLNDEKEKLRWPVTVVPWETVLPQMDSAEVVILCLVDVYDQNNLTAPKKKRGPSLFPVKGRNNITPAQMLSSYLRDVRELEEKGLMSADGAPDSKKMRIIVVECGMQTRERAREFFEKFDVRYYDNSIPVIYVFHNKQLITSYTYTRNPGMHGEKLQAQVRDIFRTK